MFINFHKFPQQHAFILAGLFIFCPNIFMAPIDSTHQDKPKCTLEYMVWPIKTGRNLLLKKILRLNYYGKNPKNFCNSTLNLLYITLTLAQMHWWIWSSSFQIGVREIRPYSSMHPYQSMYSLIAFGKFSHQYVYSSQYVYYFWPIFPPVRLFQTLEYVLKSFAMVKIVNLLERFLLKLLYVNNNLCIFLSAYYKFWSYKCLSLYFWDRTVLIIGSLGKFSEQYL